jgi:hypothetical protein
LSGNARETYLLAVQFLEQEFPKLIPLPDVAHDDERHVYIPAPTVTNLMSDESPFDDLNYLNGTEELHLEWFS